WGSAVRQTPRGLDRDRAVPRRRALRLVSRAKAEVDDLAFVAPTVLIQKPGLCGRVGLDNSVEPAAAVLGVTENAIERAVRGDRKPGAFIAERLDRHIAVLRCVLARAWCAVAPSECHLDAGDRAAFDVDANRGGGVRAIAAPVPSTLVQRAR